MSAGGLAKTRAQGGSGALRKRLFVVALLETGKKTHLDTWLSPYCSATMRN